MIALLTTDNTFLACFALQMGLDAKILNWADNQLKNNSEQFDLNEAHSCSATIENIGDDTFLVFSGDEDSKMFLLADLNSLVTNI